MIPAAAQLLSFYSITQENSAGYQAARGELAGTAEEQQAKAQAMFTQLFQKALIGGAGTTNDYSNIRYVLDKLGVENGTYDGHHHHIHFTMAVPDAVPIEESQALQTNISGEEPMFDFNPDFDLSMQLAQADTEQVLNESGENRSTWIDGSKNSLRFFKYYLRIGGREALRGDMYEYKPEGEMGMPKLEIWFPVDYYTGPLVDGRTIDEYANTIGFASQACLCLDVEAQQAGAWGPECKIAKFITLPEGKLEKWDDPRAEEGDYLYTPPRLGATDIIRFILENGEGKQVEVEVFLQAQDYRGQLLNPVSPKLNTANPEGLFVEIPGFHIAFGGILDNIKFDFSDLDNGSLGSALNQTITLDDNANGYGWYIDLTPGLSEEFLPTANPYDQ